MLSQPAFFGLLNRLVTARNLSAAVGVNVSVVQTSYILGPLLAGLLFSFGLGIAPLAFAGNALGTLIYLRCLSGVTLREQPVKDTGARPALLREVASGLTVFWANPIVFRATALSLAVSVLQRPLTSLMAAINDHFTLFSPAFFTVLTTSLMVGGLLAGLTHARRNSGIDQDRSFFWVMAALLLVFGALFPLLSLFPGSILLTMIGLGLIGYGCSYVQTGTSIILQNRTPEHMRSRVLGNALMLSRAMGAVAVLGIGMLVDREGFAVAMPLAAVVVGLVLPLALWRASRMPVA